MTAQETIIILELFSTVNNTTMIYQPGLSKQSVPSPPPQDEP